MHFARLVRPLNNHLEGDASKLKAHKVFYPGELRRPLAC